MTKHEIDGIELIFGVHETFGTVKRCLDYLDCIGDGDSIFEQTQPV